jgi:hypothetical protein
VCMEKFCSLHRDKRILGMSGVGPCLLPVSDTLWIINDNARDCDGGCTVHISNSDQLSF